MKIKNKKIVGLLAGTIISVASGVIFAEEPTALAASAAVPVVKSIPVTWKLGGFFQFDQSLLSESGVNTDSLYGLRSGRTDLIGTVADNIGYRINVEYAGGTVKLLDGHADLPVIPGWKLRLGKYKAPVGIELLQAPTDVTFIDFGYSTYFTPNRDSGVMLYGAPLGWETQVAVLTGTTDYGSSDKDSDAYRSLVVRTIGKPLRDVDGFKGMDLGLAVSTEKRVGTSATSQLSTYKGSGRPTLFTYAAGTYANGNFYRIAPQFTYYAGPFGLLGEYVVSAQDVSKASNSATLIHGAWQVQAQYYLTGENAGYKYVGPKNAYNPEKGQWGALQLAARLEEAQFDGGSFSTFATGYKSSVVATTGVNWIWSDSTKWFLNVERVWNTTIDGLQSNNTYIDLRVQVKY